MFGKTLNVAKAFLWTLRFIVFTLIIAPAIFSETAVGPDFLLTEPHARTAAMSNAFVAISDDANALIFNPAGLAMLEKNSFSLTHYASFADTNYENFLFAVNSGNFGYGGRILVDYTADFTEIDSNGASAGNVYNYDFLAQASAAWELFPGVSAGVSVKYFKSALSRYMKDGVALDAGTIIKFYECPDMYFGLAIKNAGFQGAYESVPDTLPLKLSAGLGCKQKVNEWLGITAAADLDRVLINKYMPNIGLGVEASIYDMFYISGGLGLKDTGDTFTAGAGFKPFEHVKISYAFQPYEDLGATHRISLDIFY